MASNYRPVSLTSLTCKLLEHIIASQIMQHLDRNNILHPNQHGFRSKRSCESQLILTSHDLSKFLNQRKQTDVAILDFAKAFDKVPHHRLLLKLHHYGIQGEMLNWIEAFLKNRQQRVVLDGMESTSTHVMSGVPQGSVLGPFLFLVFINDIADEIHSTIRLFADDCLLYRTIDSEIDQQILQNDLDTLIEWTNTWQMEFNVSKCNILKISQRKSSRSSSYTMNGQTLAETTSSPYLGVELNQKLKWDKHISNITSKAHRTLGFLCRNLRGCPQSIKERAYQTLVRPKVEYSSTVWDPPTIELRNQVEAVQRKAARFVSARPIYKYPTHSVSTMIKELGWESLEQRRRKSNVTLMYKLLNSHVAIPPEYHPTRSYVNTTRRSHSQKLQTYQASISQYQHSFFPRTVPLWNGLAESTVSAPDVEAFKCCIREATI